MRDSEQTDRKREIPSNGREKGAAMIRYLEQEEKGRTKELWKEAFSEDSTSFVDYYYEEKMKDNRVLVF